MTDDRARVITGDDAVRLTEELSSTVEKWFAALPLAEPVAVTEFGPRNYPRLEVVGRDQTAITLRWTPNEARRVHKVELRTIPGASWAPVDKASRLHTVEGLSRASLYQFVLWIYYTDGGAHEAQVTASTLDLPGGAQLVRNCEEDDYDNSGDCDGPVSTRTLAAGRYNWGKCPSDQVNLCASHQDFARDYLIPAGS